MWKVCGKVWIAVCRSGKERRKCHTDGALFWELLHHLSMTNYPTSDLFGLLPSIDELLRNPRLDVLVQREAQVRSIRSVRDISGTALTQADSFGEMLRIVKKVDQSVAVIDLDLQDSQHLETQDTRYLGAHPFTDRR